MTTHEALARYCIRLGDTSLILGQRLGEWCGHGPILEEDIALTNISLDLIGQTRAFYTVACEISNNGLDEDRLAFLRSEREFQNVLLAEQPNGDFAQTILRQLLISAFQKLNFEALLNSKHETVAALAHKSLKEVTYHLRHSADWTIRLGQGTEESARRMNEAVGELWMYVDDLFDMDEVDQLLIKEQVGVDAAGLRTAWDNLINGIMKEAGLSIPEKPFSIRGSRSGKHTEHLGHLLAEMQSLHRAIPGAEW